ncbi:MAG: DUF4037 domain-containing protein [Ruminococcaceae bacterium]|nr:DUF4037 domain-containing protein [Oscillospiraceae bacterium]
MKGLELSERYYKEYGEKMIRDSFREYEKYIAVGLAGSGSECFGYDDDISRDHDFEPGFCLFLPGEDVIDRKTAFALERAYAKLPKEFLGYKRTIADPVGGSRHGPIRISDFFVSRTGSPDGTLNGTDWFRVSEQALSEATNGKIFRDDMGSVTEIREKLSYFPEDIRLKKLAGNLLIMGQAGQYNYKRCILRGDSAAAQLSAIEFVKGALNAIFLINRRYIPYYKWCFRTLRDLPLLSELSAPLEYIISSKNGNDEASKKTVIIEEICLSIIRMIQSHKLSSFSGTEAEGHAYAINEKISDTYIRNLHILYAI